MSRRNSFSKFDPRQGQSVDRAPLMVHNSSDKLDMTELHEGTTRVRGTSLDDCSVIPLDDPVEEEQESAEVKK